MKCNKVVTSGVLAGLCWGQTCTLQSNAKRNKFSASEIWRSSGSCCWWWMMVVSFRQMQLNNREARFANSVMVNGTVRSGVSYERNFRVDLQYCLILLRAPLTIPASLGTVVWRDVGSWWRPLTWSRRTVWKIRTFEWRRWDVRRMSLRAETSAPLTTACATSMASASWRMLCGFVSTFFSARAFVS